MFYFSVKEFHHLRVFGWDCSISFSLIRYSNTILGMLQRLNSWVRVLSSIMILLDSSLHPKYESVKCRIKSIENCKINPQG